MKKKMTITGIFNDFLTNYEDKDCSCYKENGRCLVHSPPEGYVITDIDENK